MKINSEEYWNDRFESNGWEEAGGRLQSRNFALSQSTRFCIKPNFDGTILDFGCGLGDAIPVYHALFPESKLIGIDLSNEAIKLCREKYGEIADFKQGDHLSVTNIDIIVSSNVLEHLSNHLNVTKVLLSKCKELYITVPYREDPLCSEHVNSYDETTFQSIGCPQWEVFHCKGWSQYGWELYYHLYFKNIFRPFFGKKIVSRKKQIMFSFKK